jgi:hypothetical protein
MTEAQGPTTQVWSSGGGYEWAGKDPSLAVDFPNNEITYEYGKTVGWVFKNGRDFSRDHATDSSALVINETAADFLGFENPVGEELVWNGKAYAIIGVIEDMIIESPYAAVRPQLFHIDKEDYEGDYGNVIILKLNPGKSPHESVDKVRDVFAKYDPMAAFEYQFVDDDYERKFQNEERVG